MTRESITLFGYVAGGSSPALRKRFLAFADTLGKRLGSDVALFEASSYADLRAAIVSQCVDIAWLPPIPFIALERRDAVVPLLRIRRSGSDTFRSALVVRADSAVHDVKHLVGKRAAWVDTESASGFVVPRIELDKLGVDVREKFAQERFFHSHEAVVRAVGAGLADFGATYAGVSADGDVVRAPWLSGSIEFRVLALFGEIPGDVLAARSGWGGYTRRKEVLEAFGRVASGRHGPFSADEFRAFESAGYAELQLAVEDASRRGVLDVHGSADASGAHVLL